MSIENLALTEEQAKYFEKPKLTDIQLDTVCDMFKINIGDVIDARWETEESIKLQLRDDESDVGRTIVIPRIKIPKVRSTI